MSSIPIYHRPIEAWPGELTPWAGRRSSAFKAAYADTLDLLDRELYHLAAKRAVLQLALGEKDIRNDGLPRAAARPSHPGVVIAFDSVHGPLQYATDIFLDWQDNLRAIALGLEALRKVERYGITKRGQQYTGFRALPAGDSKPASMTMEAAAAFLATHSNGLFSAEDLMAELATPADKEWTKLSYRVAAKHLHPDRGGDPEQWHRLVAAYELLAAS